MRRALRLAAVAALVLVAAAAAPRLLDPATDAATPALPAEQDVIARATLTPSVHLFAEPVEARLELALDRRRLDPDRVEVEWDFEPYEVVGEPTLERREAGGVVYLVRTATLRCLEQPCVPPTLQSAAGEQETGRGERHVFRFDAATIRFGERREPLKARWPPLESVSRVNATEWAASQGGAQGNLAAPRFPFGIDLTPARPTYSLPPRLLAAVALAGALLCLVFPARLVSAEVRRRRRTPAETWALLTPRERAELLARWARGRDDAGERRRALELAAFELGRGGDESLSALARELAWSGDAPAPDAAGALAAQIGENGRGR